MSKSLAEIEISRVDWAAHRQIVGTAERIPAALLDLLNAPTPEAANAAYWKLDNHVVVQGALFQAAEPVVSVLLAALTETRPAHVRASLLELLFQILAGEAAGGERALSNDPLAQACKIRARERLWVLYGELSKGEREAVMECIELVETDLARLAAFRDSV